MSGRLTTHVLDTASGRPAVGMEIELFRIEAGERILLKTAHTNDDGRVDGPLLENLTAGTYEIIFHAGEYFDVGDEPAFLGEVPVRFGVSDAGFHYHVPLLVSPWSYTTYRGS